MNDLDLQILKEALDVIENCGYDAEYIRDAKESLAKVIAVWE